MPLIERDGAAHPLGGPKCQVTGAGEARAVVVPGGSGPIGTRALDAVHHAGAVRGVFVGHVLFSLFSVREAKRSVPMPLASAAADAPDVANRFDSWSHEGACLQRRTARGLTLKLAGVIRSVNGWNEPIR